MLPETAQHTQEQCRVHPAMPAGGSGHGSSVIDDSRISILPYAPNQAATWKQFVASSNNGTFFEDLDFLAYHPPGKFDVHHLLFHEGKELVAVLPAAIVTSQDGRRVLQSPYGASTGGLVLPIGQSAIQTMAIVARLNRYVRELGIHAIEMRIAPSIYHQFPNEALPFALAANGFSQVQSWLSLAIPLRPCEDLIECIPNKRKRSYIRSSLRQGVNVIEGTVEQLPAFYDVLLRNRARHQAAPTHSLDELHRLFTLLPSRMKLFLGMLGNVILGGTVIFELNDRVAYSFYPCHDDRYEQYRVPSIVLYRLLEEYSRRSFRYIDLGPTGNIHQVTAALTLNTGGASFKEDMGGIAFCRNTWRWEL